MRSKTVVDWVLPFLGALVTMLFGPWSVALRFLLIVMVLDVVSGWTRAWIQARLSSKESWRGFAKKLLIWCAVALAHQLSGPLDFPGLRDLVVGWYCMSEALSVLENLAAAGVPFPDWLADRLEAARGDKFRCG